MWKKHLLSLSYLAALLCKCLAHGGAPHCPLKPAPVFNENENLSFNDCGRKVTLSNGHSPWRAEIYSNDKYYCPGLLISRRVVITYNEDTYENNNEVTNIFLGQCADAENSMICANANSEGLNTTVLKKIKLDIQSFDFYMNLYIIPPVLEFNDWIRPICLFNRDNSMDFDPDEQYIAYSGYLVHNYTAQILNFGKCFDDTNDELLCDERNEILCVHKDGAYWTRSLINFHDGRYFLRGAYNKYTQNDTVCTFVDLLDHMEKIAAKSPDLHMLRKVPLPKENKVNKMTLSHPQCGTKWSNLRKHSRQDLLLEEDCKDDSILAEFIVQGKAALKNNHPWHADLYVPRNAVHGVCGGTLISPKAVLTAAHCVRKIRKYSDMMDDFSVELGMHNASDINESSRQEQRPSHMMEHPDFIPETLTNDIALILFDDAFNLTDYVRPVCLWNEDSGMENVANEMAEVVGWGVDESNTQPDILQEAALPIIPHKTCYFQDRSFFGKNLNPGKNFCAGYTNGTSTCHGDSGSGLVLKRGERWFIRGVVSFGKVGQNKSILSCNPNSYSVNSDVAEYLDWIYQNVPDLNK